MPSVATQSKLEHFLELKLLYILLFTIVVWLKQTNLANHVVYSEFDNLSQFKTTLRELAHRAERALMGTEGEQGGGGGEEGGGGVGGGRIKARLYTSTSKTKNQDFQNDFETDHICYTEVTL